MDKLEKKSLSCPQKGHLERTKQSFLVQGITRNEHVSLSFSLSLYLSRQKSSSFLFIFEIYTRTILKYLHKKAHHPHAIILKRKDALYTHGGEKRRKREEDDDAKNVVERESRVRRLFVLVRAVFTIETRASAVRYAFSECSYECEWFCQR